MVSVFRKLLVGCLLVFVLVISGCSTKYVCYDGSVQKDAARCPLLPTASIHQRQAENAVDTFAGAYASILGSRSHRVSIYRFEADWRADFLFTNIRTESVDQVVFEIDGRTASVSCVEGCDVLTRSLSSQENKSEVIDDFVEGGDFFIVPDFSGY